MGWALLAGGCGYGFAMSPGLPALTSGRAVRVPPFDNRSLESDAGVIATQAATQMLAIRGARLDVGPTPLVLVGTIEHLAFTPAIITGPQQVAQWHIDARMTLELREEGKPKPLARTVVVDGTNYLAATNGEIEGTEVSRRLAVHHLLEKMASDGVERLAP